MYSFVDRPVNDLCNGGRFLVWAMRGWKHAINCKSCPPHALSRGFDAMGLLAMLPDLHLTMALLSQHQLDPIAFAHINCPRIAEDEAVLISVWRDLSLGDVDNARETLSLLVEEGSAAPIARTMTAATAKMVAAGVDLAGLSIHVSEKAKPSDE